MSKHTPGPWTVTHDPYSCTVSSSERIMAEMFLPECDGIDDADELAECEQIRADGELIAAAPDLLEACESHMIALRSRVRDGQDHPEYGEAIWQAERKMAYAIKKARGDQALHIVDWNWIELPPSLKEHHAFDMLERELSKVGVKVKP